ncbi:RagB/SusD family nutrient uptake outer membrane protein [Niabella sp. CC-SYL272]|uniref:RagB/SusD family nutrient uptake outer membrane protein n=1 Tax=Niabella agricola TaxID=2891571 RepID=UPI001F3189C1|nr:RagB/SusD family nutrient uptake outer membrane protein [Niabella agricola]MCF3111307.1 RagB/SusD family nutrient uptake outer membrane protein [Niabella agricola]
MKQTALNILLGAILMMAACRKDPLDLMPDGRITIEQVFTDEMMAAEYVNTIYANMQHYGTAYNYWTMLAGYSDEAHDNDFPLDMGRAPSRWYNGELRPNWNPMDIPASTGSYDPTTNGFYYRNAWKGIRQANVFLGNIDKTVFTNPTTKARLIAEVKTLRAFFYLELIKMYGGMPVVDKPFTSDFKFETLPRQSFKECVDFIKRNCDEAIAETNFPWRITTEPERGRFTKAVAHAVRSQALLFSASSLWNPEADASRWTLAANAIKQSLEALTDAGYQLYPDYEVYFYGRSDLSPNPGDKETIYEIKPFRGTPEFSHLMFRMHAIPTLGGDKAGCSPSQELVDAYEMSNGQIPILRYQDEDHLQPVINAASGYDEKRPYVNRDPRFYATVWYNDAYYGDVNGKPYRIQSYVGGADGISNLQQRTHNGYYLRKFRNPKQLDPNTGTALFKKYRLGEIYLNYAEAANEAMGPVSEVYDAINTVRARAKMPQLPGGLSKDEMRERIRRERRVEMAFEEQRIWDVRRWKILGQTDKLTTGIEWTKTGEGQFAGKRIIAGRRKSFTDNYMIIPIPTSELTLMPLWEQNPGW